jgi:hypothetical protein
VARSNVTIPRPRLLISNRPSLSWKSLRSDITPFPGSPGIEWWLMEAHKPWGGGYQTQRYHSFGLHSSMFSFGDEILVLIWEGFLCQYCCTKGCSTKIYKPLGTIRNKLTENFGKSPTALLPSLAPVKVGSRRSWVMNDHSIFSVTNHHSCLKFGAFIGTSIPKILCHLLWLLLKEYEVVARGRPLLGKHSAAPAPLKTCALWEHGPLRSI